MKLNIYSTDTLNQAIALATENQSQAQWLEQSRRNIAALIAKKPVEYRAFGAFWWAVKKQLTEAGYLVGCATVDLERLAEVTTGDAAKDMAGALLFHNHASDQMNSGNVFPLDSDEGQVDYAIIDGEIEAIIAG